MRTIAWLFLAALALGACQQDPFRLYNYGDALPLDAVWQDAEVPPDAGPTDFRPERDPLQDLSYDQCAAILEACNGVDDNCDNQTDEGFDKLNDPRYCENCQGCSWLIAKNAFPGCAGGVCKIGTCKAGWVDKDKDPKNGCEYECTPTGAVEICDGLDNDCNGQTDEGVTAPDICKTKGACAGAKAECKGAAGWVCSYGPTVELLACTTDAECGLNRKCDTQKGVCPGMVAPEEKLCDGIDGDCDEGKDDPWMSALGTECDADNPPKKGICRSVGKYACDPVKKDQAICTLIKPGGQASDEKCNGLDDDCDGVVDDLDLTKTPDAEKWIAVGTFQIFQYEASRPDANATDDGLAPDGRPCSLPGRLPWSMVAKEEAEAACKRAGAHLCTTAQWEQACRGTANKLFPYGDSLQEKTCNGRAYDTTKPGLDDYPLVTDKPGGACVSSWPGGSIFNMSGNLKEWTATALSNGNPSGYQIKGGAYDTASIPGFGAGLSCDYDLPAPSSNLLLPTLGFRCCK